MRVATDAAAPLPAGQSSSIADATTAAPLSGRLLSADLLRFASLVSIILFHVVLRDSQYTAATAGRNSGVFDSLLCVSSVFDNRSMALLSLLLVLRRRAGARYADVAGERARRLLVPYAAWTLIYPFLDLAVGLVSGRYQPALARILDLQFWASGFLFATVTGHLHFLPTLLLLTLLLPLYRLRLPFGAAVALMSLGSAARATIELTILHAGGGPGHASTAAVLSVARIMDFLPVGFLASSMASVSRGGSGYLLSALGCFCLLGLSIVLPPEWFAVIEPSMAQQAWTIAQAMLGAVIVSLAGYAVLALPIAGALAHPGAGRLGLLFSQRALGMFLIHPFFCSLFDAVVADARAFAVWMVAPKFAFVLICSFFTSSFLVGNSRLSVIV